jgi:hypothetical protein
MLSVSYCHIMLRTLPAICCMHVCTLKLEGYWKIPRFSAEKRWRKNEEYVKYKERRRKDNLKWKNKIVIYIYAKSSKNKVKKSTWGTSGILWESA